MSICMVISTLHGPKNYSSKKFILVIVHCSIRSFHCEHSTLALGFYHMQSAHDRDDYVQIKWNNIISGYESNFNKYGPKVVTHFNGSYDYDSIMHYGAFGFSKNGDPTIVPLVSMDISFKVQFSDILRQFAFCLSSGRMRHI